MDSSSRRFELIAAYLSGNLDASQQSEVDSWVNSSPENTRLFKELRLIWQNGGMKLSPAQVDSEQLLLRIKSKIEQNKTEAKTISWSAFMKAAAAIFLIVSVTAVIRMVTREDELTVIRTMNEVMVHYLPDSTKVWLNAHSAISFHPGFEERKVMLEGEAFFLVTKGQGEFVVETTGTTTRVTGTAFNLRAVADSMVVLTVTEGSVVFAEKDAASEGLLVAASERAVYQTGKDLRKSVNDDPSFLKWREANNMVFTHEKGNPAEFIMCNYSWKKGKFNRSEIEGQLYNNASLTAYDHVVLEISYKKMNGKMATAQLPVEGTIHPGDKLLFNKSLMDIFIRAQEIKVRLKSANAAISELR